ncbi:MAG: U3 snoRNP protein [Lichina confinis]|nr:MAG: U3 snoRNP protein [Lichina confinis]
MAGASDRARSYLEKSVPELHELERKGIFTKDEVSAIVKKRADFEHRLDARGCRPSDYAQYAEYEMNLESLRRRRVKRLGVRIKTYVGGRRIFAILDRATRRFKGDIGLWMQYTEYARAEKSNRKFLLVMTDLLRLHPTKPDLWVYAAQYAVDVQADMTGARTYLQRGLRFCKRSKDMWLEYAKLELIYIGKIEGRRRILGVDDGPTQQAAPAEDDPDADMIALPTITDGELDPSPAQKDTGETTVLKNLKTSPALAGAVPRTIFDAAMKEFPGDEALAKRFFDLFEDFVGLTCARSLLEHALEHLRAVAPTSVTYGSCYFRLPVLGVDVNSAVFPSALRTSFERLKALTDQTSDTARLCKVAIWWLLSALTAEELDPAIQGALVLMLRKTCGRLNEALAESGTLDAKDMEHIRESILNAGYAAEAGLLQLEAAPR